jgi:hypothetical protein
VITDGENNIKENLNQTRVCGLVASDSEEESVPLFCLHGMNMQDPKQDGKYIDQLGDNQCSKRTLFSEAVS